MGDQRDAHHHRRDDAAGEARHPAEAQREGDADRCHHQHAQQVADQVDQRITGEQHAPHGHHAVEGEVQRDAVEEVGHRQRAGAGHGQQPMPVSDGLVHHEFPAAHRPHRGQKGEQSKKQGDATPEIDQRQRDVASVEPQPDDHSGGAGPHQETGHRRPPHTLACGRRIGAVDDERCGQHAQR